MSPARPPAPVPSRSTSSRFARATPPRGDVRRSTRRHALPGTLSWLFHMERFLEPRNHPRLVVLLIGILPRTHTVSARLDRDDVAGNGNLPHRVAQQRRLLVWDLVVARAVDRQKRRHALVNGEQRRDTPQFHEAGLVVTLDAKEPDATAGLLVTVD